MIGVDPYSAIWLSLAVGIMTVVLGAPPAISLGWVLAKKSFPGKAVIGTLVQAPLVLPPVVTGLLLLTCLGKNSFIGRILLWFGITIPFSFIGCAVAGMTMGLPLFVMSARTTFELIDPRYEEVSATLGRSPWRTFFSISLPLAFPGLAAGAILSFMRALGEFGATAVLAGNMEGKTRTISLAIYTLLEMPESEERTRVLILASLLLSFAALLGYELLIRLLRRRLDLPLER